MRALGISAISLVLTAAVITNAYYHKKQFYPSVVYITKSNASMAVIYIQSLVLVLMLGKLMRKVFLGSLRAAEFEHLMERFWYALTETCLAFTVFRDDFNPKFVALFTVLLFLKSFHWLAEDRVDYMERSPVIGWLFHIRVSALLTVLGMLDYMLIAHAYHSTITKGATVQLVFGFEYAILITMVANTTIKYVLHAAELRADSPWENKAVFLLYTELVIGFIRVVLYVLFVVIMVRIYTLPLFAFRPMYYTMRNFKKALNDVILSRRAIRNMNTLYPDATSEELSQSDNICIICREDMVNNSKKLPCGHIFHTSCLRSWFQRQQTCPTCRLNILRTSTPTAVGGPNNAAAAGGGAGGAAAPAGGNDVNQAPGPVNINNNNIPQPEANLFANLLATPPGGLPPQLPFTQTFPNAIPFLNSTAGGQLPTLPMTYPHLSPFMVPPPPMPPSLDTLSDEELRTLEGTERRHVEERIKLLQNIQLLLDASVSLMNQYSMVVSRLPQPPLPIVQPTGINVVFSTAGVGASSLATNVITSQPSSSSSCNITVPAATTVVGSAAVAAASTTSSDQIPTISQPTTKDKCDSDNIPGTSKDSSENKATSSNISINTKVAIDTATVDTTIATTTITNTTTATNVPAATTTNGTKSKENLVKIEDVGSEEDIDLTTSSLIDQQQPSISLASSSSPSTSSSFVDTSEAAAELRRRRLQKFSQN